MPKPTWTVAIRDRNPVHTRVAVYNRGGLSGVLVVNTRDADDLVARLLATRGGNDNPETLEALVARLATDRAGLDNLVHDLESLAEIMRAIRDEWSE